MQDSAASINKHLDQTLASPLFRKAERQARFLRYVVDTALEDPEALIKEFDIGIAVYDRRDDYDPRADPIVRVEAARLRARLREHYEVTPPAEVKIDLPKGGYVPKFTFLNTPVTPAEEMAPQPVPAKAPDELSVVVQPFRSLSTDPENQNFCDGLTEELVHRLAQRPKLRVIAQGALERSGAGIQAASRYLVEGSIRHAGQQIRVTSLLVDRSDGSTRISGVYPHTLEDIFLAQEEVAGQIAEDIWKALGVEEDAAGVAKGPG